ncbi:hypothetical protein DFAR_2690007 [Desulfarculales bacterium]
MNFIRQTGHGVKGTGRVSEKIIHGFLILDFAKIKFWQIYETALNRKKVGTVSGGPSMARWGPR